MAQNVSSLCFASDYSPDKGYGPLALFPSILAILLCSFAHILLGRFFHVISDVRYSFNTELKFPENRDKRISVYSNRLCETPCETFRICIFDLMCAFQCDLLCVRCVCMRIKQVSFRCINDSRSLQPELSQND